MTKKDYLVIAEVFAESGEEVESLAHLMADALQEENPCFNREKFLKACGICTLK